jgi:putative ribosome biogenesis GTPase RsgA
LAAEPECALDTAVETGTITVERVDSLRRILEARTAGY